MSIKQKIVITGGTGRIGQALLNAAQAELYEVHIIVRRKRDLPDIWRDYDSFVFHEIGDLATCRVSDLVPIFRNAASVIHLAAVISENLSTHESVTVGMARNVADAVAKGNVQNVILLSSIYASMAEQQAVNARAYGYRKLVAERYFERTDRSSVIILRPPAVYGPGMGGTLKLLTTLVKYHVPLPLGLANQPRDYISINNLVELIWHITERQVTSSSRSGLRIYEPCDGRSLSTKMLVTEIARALARRALLVPVPISLLKIGAEIIGQTELIDGAVGEMTASGNKALLDDFGWTPMEQTPASLDYLKA